MKMLRKNSIDIKNKLKEMIVFWIKNNNKIIISSIFLKKLIIYLKQKEKIKNNSKQSYRLKNLYDF